MFRYQDRRLRVGLRLVVALVVGYSPYMSLAYAATFTLNNLDGLSEGFNDPSTPDPASTLGGNTGNTLGEQRRIAYAEAAAVWADALTSSVPIAVDAAMDPLTCTATSGTLGSASAVLSGANFGGAPRSDTWYPIAMANMFAGSDQKSTSADISMTLNSAVGTADCLSSGQWYYGLDGITPAGAADFVNVILHELAHGLGFASLVNKETGEELVSTNGVRMPDIYSVFLADRGAINLTFPDMTDAERVLAIRSVDDLVWVGANVNASAPGLLSGGRHAVTGEVLMYAPDPVEAASSVSHFDKSLSPNELMEPTSISSPDRTLTLALMEDLGWVVNDAQLPTGNLESPGADSHKSGIGIISGWVCSADSVVVTVDGTAIQTGYGTERTDTESVCGDSDNGFGALWNWNKFGDGLHTAVAYADGVEFDRANFTVTTFGVEFLSGKTGAWYIPDFPDDGNVTYIQWDQSEQNFVIYAPTNTPAGGSASAGANLESPGRGSHKSGIGIISGWHCSASEVVVVIDGVSIQTGYGTERTDTESVCGDSDNGFGALWNWNKFGDGLHTAIAYADGVEFARANFAVQTFGVEFLSGTTGSWSIPDFPDDGNTTFIRWDEAVQNIAITAVQ